MDIAAKKKTRMSNHHRRFFHCDPGGSEGNAMAYLHARDVTTIAIWGRKVHGFLGASGKVLAEG